MIVGRTEAPRDCFWAFRETIFCNCEFSVATSSDEGGSETDESDDNDEKYNQRNANNKRQRTDNIEIAEV